MALRTNGQYGSVSWQRIPTSVTVHCSMLWCVQSQCLQQRWKRTSNRPFLFFSPLRRARSLRAEFYYTTEPRNLSSKICGKFCKNFFPKICANFFQKILDNPLSAVYNKYIICANCLLYFYVGVLYYNYRKGMRLDR